MEKTASSSTEESRPTHRLAIAAVICAGLGFSILPVLGSVLGFVLAARAQRVLDAAPDRFKGQDQIRWARALGILAVVVWFVALIAVLVARWFMHHEPMV